mgnify:FL=1|jgi:hypothetical protein|tara:strand:+ start:336 stop:665 length:330 start_codon:yes stop_codon:yes gene_type:complete
MVEDYNSDAILFDEGFPLFLDHDLEISDNGMLNIKSFLTVGDLDEQVILKPFFEITEYVLANPEINYRELYAISNELVSEAERLRTLAQRMEDSTDNVADLFDAGYDPD